MAAKARTNISIDAALLAEARALDINVSAVLEAPLRAIVAAERQRRWLEENRAAIESCNRFVAEHGLWSDGLRQF